MSKDIEFKLNLPGLNEIMKGKAMQATLNDAAGKIASAAGKGYRVWRARPRRYVAIASARTGTAEARRDNNRSRTLETAAGGVKI